ncbi:MAG: transposase [Bacteroidota bacterium]
MSSEPQDKLRRKFTPDQKFKIIKEQMTTRTSVSDICKKYDISAGNFYKWQDKFLKAALEGFKKTDDGPTKAELRKIAEQEQKIQKMQAAITEIIQENIELKKNLGE